MDALPLRAAAHLLRKDTPPSRHHLRHQLLGIIRAELLQLGDVTEVLDGNAQDVLLVPKSVSPFSYTII